MLLWAGRSPSLGDMMLDRKFLKQLQEDYRDSSSPDTNGADGQPGSDAGAGVDAAHGFSTSSVTPVAQTSRHASRRTSALSSDSTRRSKRCARGPAPSTKHCQYECRAYLRVHMHWLTCDYVRKSGSESSSSEPRAFRLLDEDEASRAHVFRCIGARTRARC